MSDTKAYDQIFEYLSAEQLPSEAESTVVFGRKDPLVAQAAGELVVAGLVETMVISGGIGKDSGDILDQGYRSEAHYLEVQLQEDAKRMGYATILPKVTLDEAASNGGENARNSVNILNGQAANTDVVTAVAHATSARRLSEMLKHEGGKINGAVPRVFVKPSHYSFDAKNPNDQAEARAELLRIADWPAKGWLGEQADVPENLVDFARDTGEKSPVPIASWQSAALKVLPPKLRLQAITFAAKHGRK